MVHIVNSSQQITHAALAPASIHSRWINLQLLVAAGVLNKDTAFTPTLGNTFRLLEMQLTVFPSVIDAIAPLFIHLRTGSSRTPTQEDVAVNWDDIIQHAGVSTPRFLFAGQQITLKWPMNRLYTGEGRRLGCVIENISSTVGARVWVGFRISEG